MYQITIGLVVKLFLFGICMWTV